MTPQDKFPWHRLRREEYFFVPAIDVQRIAIEGRSAALASLGHLKVAATPCIYQGVLGVMFRLR